MTLRHSSAASSSIVRLAGKDARVQHQHVQPAIGEDRALERKRDRALVVQVASDTEEVLRAGNSCPTAELISRPTTAAPRASKASTQALPMPEAAPVTRAISPA